MFKNKLIESFGLTKPNDMSTLQLLERHLSPFDILFKNHFNAEEKFAPALNSKQPHPLNIFYDDKGLHFEVACTGLTKKDVILNIEGDIEIPFDSDIFKDILSANKDMSTGILRISEVGMLKLNFTTEETESEYFIARNE